MRSAHSRVWISVAVVAVYTLVPVFAGFPAGAPAAFGQSLAGVPVGVIFVVALLFGFPLIALLSASASSRGEDEQ
jgi:hypothetical protein